MPGKVQDRPSIISFDDIEAVSRLVLEVEAQVAAEAEHRSKPKPVDNTVVVSIARRLQQVCGGVNTQGLVGLPDRSIATVDFETVFAALSLAAHQAKVESRKLALPVTGL